MPASARRFDEIVAFAEVDRFLDTPVKHYSSGMQLRLAFAVAAHLDSEILILDDVLAVCDALIADKCLRRIDSIAHQGRSIILVSHNLRVVENLCTRSIWIDQGRIVMEGSASSVISAYLAKSDHAPHATTSELIGQLPADPSFRLLRCTDLSQVRNQPRLVRQRG